MGIKEDVESDVQEGVRVPLMAEGDEAAGGSSGGNLWMVNLSTFVAVCGSYEFGCCVGYSSPTQSAIREDLSLSLSEYSVFGSILTFGAMIGAITIGPITDFLGRKGALRVSCAFCVAGWLAIYFSKGAWSLDIGRLLTGYGMGAFFLRAEIAPKNLRGRLTAANQLMIVTGVSVSFIIGGSSKLADISINWTYSLRRDNFWSLFSFPSLQDGWQRQDAREILKPHCRNCVEKDADISHEAAEIQDYIVTLDSLPKAKLLDLFQRRYWRSLIIGIGLMVCQQLGGINGVCFYVSDIFEQAGFSSSIGTIIYAILQVIVTGIAAGVMDKAGRKPLILVSASGLVLGSLLTAVSFFLKVHELALDTVPILAVTGILVYIGAFSIGMGAVPWVVMSEIFPINIKGQAGSLATLVNWFGAWLCSYTFNYLMSWSSYGTFILYAGINSLAILFVVSLVPETKGKTLEQIQGAMNK